MANHRLVTDVSTPSLVRALTPAALGGTMTFFRSTSLRRGIRAAALEGVLSRQSLRSYWPARSPELPLQLPLQRQLHPVRPSHRSPRSTPPRVGHSLSLRNIDRQVST